MGIDWRLAYLTPVLTCSLLGSPGPRPTAKMAVGFIGVVAVASAVGVGLSALLLPYPAAFLLIEGLVLFLLFYAGGRGAPALVIALLLISCTVIPVVALQSIVLALAAGQGLVWAAVGAMSVTWVAHVLVPQPPAISIPGAAEKGRGGRSPTKALAVARLNTMVVYPVVYLYFVTGMTSVLVLVFICLLSMQPDVSSGVKAGKALIAGNVMGGLAAVVVYELLVMMPQFGFLLLLTLLGGLAFGGKLFSAAPTAPLFGMAYSTMLLIVGSSTSMFGDADSKAWTRVIQITVAVVYLVVAVHVVPKVLGVRRARPGKVVDATA
jgi:hypothetical protein